MSGSMPVRVIMLDSKYRRLVFGGAFGTHRAGSRAHTRGARTRLDAARPLAHEAGLSRAAFVRNFRASVGEPPHSYLKKRTCDSLRLRRAWVIARSFRLARFQVSSWNLPDSLPSRHAGSSNT
jgi:hypothetical protein